ncbi:hypothetical protein [Actinoallomurus sp. CA-150999]|uniref:hypothetical protein n=1 Tax=Actinoallomurus sp. CA-150999 TaxID=3239887 RepID=UPI003D90E099
MELYDLLREGWIIGPVESMLLRGLYSSGWRSDWKVNSVSGYEFEVNDVGITDVGLPSDRDRFLEALVARARSFACHAIKDAQNLNYGNLLTAVISIGIDDDYLTHGATVKFFTRTAGCPQFFDDIERFQLEAMAIIEVFDCSD